MSDRDMRPEMDDSGQVADTRDTFVAGLYKLSDGSETTLTIELGTDTVLRKTCDDIRTYDICGKGRTHSETGEDVLLLSNIICGDFSVAQPDVYFVATPYSETPAFLTFKTEFEYRDVRVTVYTWNFDGSPSGGINFTWQCCLKYAIIVE